MQDDDISIVNGKVSGTLHYISDGVLAQDWGAGNFIALKFTNLDESATSVKVGLDPSVSSGLVEIINDPDKNGVFKVTDTNTQVFKVVSTDGTNTRTQVLDLSGLTLETE